VSSSESRVPGPSPGRNGTVTLPVPAVVEPPAASHDGLPDPSLWRERLEAFAHATNLAVPLTDDVGPPLQVCIGLGLMAHDRRLGASSSGDAEISGRLHTEAEARLAKELAQLTAVVVESIEVNRALREADRHKDEFLAVVGHELRNPLATISNAIQLVRLRSLADPELGSATEVLEHQVQQMTRLIDDLVDVSRVRQGKIHLQSEVVDLRNVVALAVETSRPRIDARKHHLGLSLPDWATEVDGDLSRLTQVVSNLLNNSAKYTEEGGRIELSLEADGDQAILRVSDTGVGIAPAMLPTIFDLFTQVPGNEDRSEGGLGIGLSLVRNLIELHGGRVQARSAGLGHGSEFVVRLPLSRTGHPPTPTTARIPEEASGGPSRRILVIDDNRDAADTMAMLLRVIGHEARTAYDGPMALELAKQQPPEVVLCDISMPGMNGLEVAYRLRHELGLRDTLIVAVTGYGQEEDKRRSQQADFDAHLVKPVSLEILKELLAREISPTCGLP
jgi:signal transduction histidine kinase